MFGLRSVMTTDLDSDESLRQERESTTDLDIIQSSLVPDSLALSFARYPYDKAKLEGRLDVPVTRYIPMSVPTKGIRALMCHLRVFALCFVYGLSDDELTRIPDSLASLITAF